MKIESNQKENTGIPVAFIDGVGDLWFRATHESDVMDNEVYVIKTGETTEVFYYNTDVFLACINNNVPNSSYNYAVKKFYKGDSVTINF